MKALAASCVTLKVLPLRLHVTLLGTLKVLVFLAYVRATVPGLVSVALVSTLYLLPPAVNTVPFLVFSRSSAACSASFFSSTAVLALFSLSFA